MRHQNHPNWRDFHSFSPLFPSFSLQQTSLTLKSACMPTSSHSQCLLRPTTPHSTTLPSVSLFRPFRSRLNPFSAVTAVAGRFFCSVYRGFWSIFMLIGVAAVVLGGFAIICAAPFCSHRLYKAGGSLFLTSGEGPGNTHHLLTRKCPAFDLLICSESHSVWSVCVSLPQASSCCVWWWCASCGCRCWMWWISTSSTSA